MKNKEICVPASALAQPDDAGESVTPAVGDTVNFEVEGKVTRVEGENVYVAPSKLGGESPQEDAAEAPAEDTPESMDAMMNGAGAAQENNYP